MKHITENVRHWAVAFTTVWAVVAAALFGLAALTAAIVAFVTFDAQLLWLVIRWGVLRGCVASGFVVAFCYFLAALITPRDK